MTDRPTSRVRTTGRHRSSPRRVSRRWLVVLALAGTGIAASVYVVGATTWLLGFLVTYSVFNLITSGIEVRWRLYGRRTPEARQAMAFPPAVLPAKATRRFSLIVPALDEAAVIGQTIDTLVQQTHPDVEIVISLAEGDDATIHEARAAAANLSRVVLVIRDYDKSSKPQQLNAALELCSGDYVGVFDAEDDVAVDLLLHVEALIDETDADVVQGGVQLVNLDLPVPENATFLRRCWTRLRGWYCVHNDMEYFFWFSSRMFYQVDQGFVPLGGNTVFIRRELLQKVGGWPLSLTEDCALGVQLAVEHNAKVVAAYEPRLTTREETPPRLFGKGSLDRQRRRWHQGFLSVLLDGKWRQMPSVQQRLMALYILAMPFIQAANALMLSVSIVTIVWLTAPVGYVLWMFSPFIPIITTMSLQLVGLHEFSRQFEQNARPWHYASLALGNYLYQMVLAWSAVMGVKRLIAGENNWLKTVHDGLHRSVTVSPATVPADHVAGRRIPAAVGTAEEEGTVA
jgi:cellulose synthase/poly-beta-1,6-N-acetylglucosamine synthase-like glycosyltransferase